ncbi:MAG: hypothetical protein U9O66_04185 [Patescibacteria group bacterium]|nr:hypothetical protein [Patescibacteria group bacterium]
MSQKEFRDPSWDIAQEQQESSAEREINEYVEQMQEALGGLLVDKARSEITLREAFKDSLILNRCFDNVIADIEGNLDLDVTQGVVDKFISKYDLDAKKFSIYQLQELIAKTDQKN